MSATTYKPIATMITCREDDEDAMVTIAEYRQLERENAELRRDVYQCSPTSENDYEGFKWRDACEELECEVAELRKALADAEELERYSGSNGERQWGRCSAWLHPDDAVIVISAKVLDAARKEAQP